MTTVTLTDPTSQEALGRAAIYQLLSLGFAYPDASTLDELDAYLVDVAEHQIAERDGIATLVHRLREAAARTDPVELAGEHLRLFAGEVLCSACETEYAFDPFAKSRQLADIAGFYRAFGLEVARDRRGAPDFIATELEFVGLLLRKRVFAAAQGWREQVEVTDQAIGSFLTDHLGRWAVVLCIDLRREARDAAGFFAALAELCEAFIAAEIELAGVRPDPVRPRSQSPADAAPFGCPLVREPLAPGEGTESG
jgi:putative dimethyl sulfoxide reductase chaperone